MERRRRYAVIVRELPCGPRVGVIDLQQWGVRRSDRVITYCDGNWGYALELARAHSDAYGTPLADEGER